MRNVVRTMLALAAMAAMLGGMLGPGGTVAEASGLTSAMSAAIDSLAAAERAGAVPAVQPRWGLASRVHGRISTNPSPEYPLGKLIEISIADQRLTAWQDGKIVYRFVVSTAGPGYRTPRGHFKILNKARRWYSRQWQVWMPEALRFHGSYFIHGLTYKSDPARRSGARELGRPASHGCVRVGVAESKLLWNWASEGLPVWVH